MTLVARLLAVLLALGAAAIAEPIRWGEVKGGLRMGIRATDMADRQPAFEVVIENVGVRERAIEYSDVGGGPAQNIRFHAVRNGEVLDVFDTATLRQPTPGLVKSGSLVLTKGDQRSFIVPFDRLICVINRRDMPLRAVITQTDSLRATFTAAGVLLTTPDITIDRALYRPSR